MQNTTELRNELTKSFNDLKEKKTDVTTVKALVAITNNVLKSAYIEADYNKFLGLRTEIKFLKTPE